MSWEPGRERIRELIDAAEVDQVTADLAIACRMLDDAERHLGTASQASLLEAQGLRATSRGGHLAVQEAVIAQFGSAVRAFRSFGRIRRARNSFEYPSSDTPGPTADDVDDAITVANQVRDAAATILNQDVLSPWS